MARFRRVVTIGIWGTLVGVGITGGVMLVLALAQAMVATIGTDPVVEAQAPARLWRVGEDRGPGWGDPTVQRWQDPVTRACFVVVRYGNEGVAITQAPSGVCEPAPPTALERR
jgi:hypothetical protein